MQNPSVPLKPLWPLAVGTSRTLPRPAGHGATPCRGPALALAGVPLSPYIYPSPSSPGHHGRRGQAPSPPSLGPTSDPTPLTTTIVTVLHVRRLDLHQIRGPTILPTSKLKVARLVCAKDIRVVIFGLHLRLRLQGRRLLR